MYSPMVKWRKGVSDDSQITHLIRIGHDSDIVSVLILHEFHVCKFTYSLTFISNSERMVFSWSFNDKCRPVKILSHPMRMFLGEVERGNTLPSCFSSHTINKCPFHGLLSAMGFFASLCFLLVILQFESVSNIALMCRLVFLSAERL